MKPLSVFKKRAFTLAVLAVILGFSGCALDHENGITPDDDGQGNEVTITVNIPATQVPTTRSIAAAGGEAVVKYMDVLVFGQGSAVGDPEVLLEHVHGMDITQSSTSTDNYKVRFQANLSTNSSARTIVLVANASDETAMAISASGGLGASKGSLLSALIYAQSNPGGTSDGWKWNANAANSSNPVAGTHYTPIPMYGEAVLPPGGITSGMSINDVDLVRMLARIDVLNSAANFTLSNVYVVNYNTGGYIAPAFDRTNGVLESLLPVNPMISSAANQQIGVNDAMVYAYADNNGAGICGEIYTCEAKAATGEENTAGHLDAACLILEGTYSGKVYFYRVDFTAGTDASGIPTGQVGFDPLKVSYMPLYRNHRYTVEISAVEGVGYVSADDALRSLGIMNNLKTELLVVDESSIANIVFNGQYYLGTGNEVIFDASSGLTAKAPCVTDYIDGWQIDDSKGVGGIEFASGDPVWLSVAKNPADPSAKIADLRLETLLTNATAIGRVAYVHLKAGRLSHELQVTQAPGVDAIISFTTKPYYGLNYGTHTFTVHSNIDWRITNIREEEVTNPDGISSALRTSTASNRLAIGTTGGDGDAVSFNVVYDYGGYRGYIYVDFETSDGFAFSGTTTVRLYVKGNIWARSNIVYDYANDRLTFAVDRADNIATPATSQGVFFLWGSLVAISPTALTSDNSALYTAGKYPNGHVLYSPIVLNTYTWSTGIPYINDTTAPFNGMDVNADDFINYNNGTGYDATAAKGDVCRFISDQLGWISGTGRWRMPTYQDLDGLDKGNRPLYGTNWTDIQVTPFGEDPFGFYQLQTGRVYGADGSSINPSNPDYGVTFPATGYRATYSNTSTPPRAYGEAINNSYRGHYWAGASYGTGNARNFVIGTGGQVSSFPPRRAGLAVRCVRED